MNYAIQRIDTYRSSCTINILCSFKLKCQFQLDIKTIVFLQMSNYNIFNLTKFLAELILYIHTHIKILFQQHMTMYNTIGYVLRNNACILHLLLYMHTGTHTHTHTHTHTLLIDTASYYSPSHPPPDTHALCYTDTHTHTHIITHTHITAHTHMIALHTCLHSEVLCNVHLHCTVKHNYPPEQLNGTFLVHVGVLNSESGIVVQCATNC